jgi:DNA-binding NarL/FixJ family response regulator
LPPRLREVLAGLARGLSEKQVAAELGLSPHTVHDHVKALHRRLRVQSRGELLALALNR